MDSWMYASTTAGENDAANNGIASARTSLDDARNHYSGTQAGPVAVHDHDPHDSSRDGARTAAGAPRIRRRNRAIQSCLECRRRKLKCDKQAPCSNCTRFRRDCLYLAPALDPQSQQKLSDLKEKMGALEKNLEREVAERTRKAHAGGANVTKVTMDQIKTEIEEDEDEGEHEEDGLEPTPLAALDQVYEDNVDDELMDLGVQLGKMRISERVGGWLRPKLVDELNDTLQDVKTSKSRWSTTPMQNDHRDLRPAGPKIQASPKSYIGPGPDYIAPASSFFFPGTSMSPSLLDYLPSKNAADQLVAQYWKAVHYMCKCVHKPTFEAQYTLFWGQIATGSEPVPSVQAIMFAAMFSAAVSMNDDDVLRQFGTSKPALVDSLRSATESALAKANFLRTTKVDTMQAFVMYLVPLVRAEVSRAHSALVGTAIRLAECMGLHRDGTLYGLNAIEVQVRRLIWHQLCFLDMRTCEATGPRPQIRREDYDTKMPLNVDDVDLLGPNPCTEDKNAWTDATFQRIRCENQEMRRQVWFDIIQIDKKKKSLSSVLIKIQKYRASMEEKFFPLCDETVPIQRLAKMVFEMGSRGIYLATLHRYLFSTTQRMPDRLRQLLIEAGLCQMETGIVFETTPELQQWTWYRGAVNQYHAALLLMVEVYAYPMRKEAARIWKCLDYIFEIPSHLAPKQKAELVLEDLRDRMEVYQQMRKVKVSNQMEERVGASSKSQFRHVGAPNQEVVPDAAALGVGTASTLPPVSFSPPQQFATESSSANSDSRQGSMHPPAAVDGTMMDDSEWAEWEKVFDPSVYTGELNVSDFNMMDFTGDFNNAPPIDPHTFNAAAAAAASNINAPRASMNPMAYTATVSTAGNIANEYDVGDMSDVNFTPALLDTRRWPRYDPQQ